MPSSRVRRTNVDYERRRPGRWGRLRRPHSFRRSRSAKSYGGAQALRGVSLSIVPGEVHGLVGANGAGKSTLIKVLAGLTEPDGGEIVVDGQPTAIGYAASRQRARHELHPSGAGLRAGHDRAREHHARPAQEDALRHGRLARRSRATSQPIAKRVGITAPLNAPAQGLSTAENWLINICRALVRKARLIVMDEPTASLSASECRAAVRHHPRPVGVGRRGALRLAPARRDPRPLRPRDRVPRRPLGRRARPARR